VSLVGFITQGLGFLLRSRPLLLRSRIIGAIVGFQVNTNWACTAYFLGFYFYRASNPTILTSLVAFFELFSSSLACIERGIT
jgi:drug/metabolite transporter (DMT)-like permease